jgi:hypothetical protein
MMANAKMSKCPCWCFIPQTSEFYARWAQMATRWADTRGYTSSGKCPTSSFELLVLLVSVVVGVTNRAREVECTQV